MIRFLYSLAMLLLFLSGCTTPRHDDQWRYEAAAATKAYGDSFLKDDDVMIASEYQQAVNASKQSADLTPMARLQLSRCALNRAVLLDDACDAYRKITAVQSSPELEAYYAMLEGTLQPEQVELLPKQYRKFAEAYLKQDTQTMLKTLQNITPLQSKMVAASTALEILDEPTVESIIDEASRLGYRRAVIAWMQHLEKMTSDPDKQEMLGKKLELLEK